MSYWCNCGVDFSKEGYAVFILVLSGSYVNFIVLVGNIFGVVGGKYSLALISVPRV